MYIYIIYIYINVVSWGILVVEISRENIGDAVISCGRCWLMSPSCQRSPSSSPSSCRYRQNLKGPTWSNRFASLSACIIYHNFMPAWTKLHFCYDSCRDTRNYASRPQFFIGMPPLTLTMFMPRAQPCDGAISVSPFSFSQQNTVKVGTSYRFAQNYAIPPIRWLIIIFHWSWHKLI
jgi:hypothetical protein